MFLSFASDYQPLACDLCYEYSNTVTDPDTDAPYRPQDIPDHIPSELLRLIKSTGCDHKFCRACLEKAYLSAPFALLRNAKNGYLPCPCPFCEPRQAWTLQDLYHILPRPTYKRLLNLYREFQGPERRIQRAPAQTALLRERIKVAEFPHLPIYCLECDTALEKTVACNEIRHCSYSYCWICGFTSRGSIPGDHWKMCPQFEHLYAKTIAPSYQCVENDCYNNEHSCSLWAHETGRQELLEHRRTAQLRTLGEPH